MGFMVVPEFCTKSHLLLPMFINSALLRALMKPKKIQHLPHLVEHLSCWHEKNLLLQGESMHL
jgi:hypothetical protein